MKAGVIQKARVMGSKPGAVKLNSFGPLGENLQHPEIDSKCPYHRTISSPVAPSSEPLGNPFLSLDSSTKDDFYYKKLKRPLACNDGLSPEMKMFRPMKLKAIVAPCLTSLTAALRLFFGWSFVNSGTVVRARG